MTALGPTWRTRPEPRPFTVEQLAVALTEQRGMHAMYPTAQRTLCGLPADTLVVEVRAGDEHYRPDCLVCETTAAAHDKIDHSAPATWFRA
jgi:hypothetical protein